MGEAFFHRHLDAAPADSAARLLLAEWLDERGDWRASGYRWMGECAKRPWMGDGRPTWFNDRRGVRRHAPEDIGPDIFEKIAGGQRSVRVGWVDFDTRHAAEEALAAALTAASS
jgi:uncharacterized protein (TIGR02996 family)